MEFSRFLLFKERSIMSSVSKLMVDNPLKNACYIFYYKFFLFLTELSIIICYSFSFKFNLFISLFNLKTVSLNS